MAKSRCEPSLRGAPTKRGDVAVSKVRRGEQNSAWPGQKLLRGAEIPRFTRNKLRNLGTGSLI
jgi:hypothetical protein